MKISFLGPIAPPISGPGVKNEMMLNWLLSNSDLEINIINTQGFKLNAKLLLSFIKNKIIVLSVSKNGRFLLIPLCFLFRKKVFLFPAGGSFDEEIKSLPGILKRLFLVSTNCIVATYPQTKKLQKGLQDLKFSNVKYFPNPRFINNYKAEVKFQDVFRIIFLSKIRETKGPLLLINALERVREGNPRIKIYLDFYGLIDDSFKDKFLNSLSVNAYNKYNGLIQPDEVQSIISQYNLFVLPTFYKGEGVPGALLEAMMTGIPIITTDFTGVEELITNNENGFVIQQNNQDELVLAINTLIREEHLRKKFSERVKLKAQEFNINNLMPIIVGDLKNDIKR